MGLPSSNPPAATSSSVVPRDPPSDMPSSAPPISEAPPSSQVPPTLPSGRSSEASNHNEFPCESSRPAGAVEVASDMFVPADPNMARELYSWKIKKQGWQRFLDIDHSLRTWLSGAMIYVENTLEFLKGLEVSDLTKKLQNKLRFLGPALEEIVQDLKSPYLDNGSLSILGLERIQNLVFRDGKGSIFRLNINMTDANKIDPSGNLGTAFKYTVLEWLQDEFGKRHITLNPEGSSFLAINVSQHEMSCSLGRFEREIIYRLRQDKTCERYDYSASLVNHFTPSAVGMFMTITGQGLGIEETLASSDAEAILVLQRRVIERIADSLRLLAVGNMLAEKDPASIGLEAGLAVYDAADLPIEPSHEGYDIFQKQFSLGLGYVPPTVFRSRFAEENVSSEDRMIAAHPRLAHDFGHLDRPVRKDDNDGGALQILMRALETASDALNDEQKMVALDKLHRAADGFSLALDVGRIARLNPRNPAFDKLIQEVKLSKGTGFLDSYFIERAALHPENELHLTLFELDSFKAFSSRYSVDEFDTSFWSVFDHVFSVAQDLSIDKPLMAQVAGDLVIAAVPIKDFHGNNVDISTFVRMVQERISRAYEDKPFQDYGKVELTNGNGRSTKVERWPLWQKGKAIFPSLSQPEDSEPYMNTLTATAVATTAITPRTGQDLRTYSRIIEKLAARVEDLKSKTSPQKGEFAFFYYEDLAPPELPKSIGAPATIGGMYRVSERCWPSGPVNEGFERSMKEQFHEAWGERWNALGQPFRTELVERLSELAPSSPPILTSRHVMSIISGMQCVQPMQFPPAPFLFLPPLTVVG
ncbi:MAG: hypothetical protein ABH871_01265 [Pseudomonadota bacterium]